MNMKATKLISILFFSFSLLLPCLEADIAEYDEVWKQRAQEAMKSALEAYQPDPEKVTEQTNMLVHKATDDLGNHTRTNNDPRNHTRTNDDPRNHTRMNEHPRNDSRVNDDPRNQTRRNLRRYLGPCRATNPIDRCWRCKKNWAKNRKKLAKCILGFGRKTTGGKAGKYYMVTDPSDNDLVDPKPGTLRHAVIQTGPLWIIFKCSMVIKLHEELMITCDKTIDGRGANVHIAYGAGITIQFVHNVIIHGIHIHDICESSGGVIRDSMDHVGIRTKSDGDGITVFGSNNVWLDHLSMRNCKDGLIDVIEGSTAITISNCHFTRHNDVLLFGASDSNPHDKIMQITVAFNHFGQGLVQRMPRCRWGFFHVLNNDYTHWLMYAIGGSSHPTIISQGNRFIAPENPAAKEVTKRECLESEWQHWTWRSEGDLFMNGAFFVQSGNAKKNRPFSKKDMITAKPGSFVTRLTRFAGKLNCRIGKAC